MSMKNFRVLLCGHLTRPAPAAIHQNHLFSGSVRVLVVKTNILCAYFTVNFPCLNFCLMTMLDSAVKSDLILISILKFSPLLSMYFLFRSWDKF